MSHVIVKITRGIRVAWKASKDDQAFALELESLTGMKWAASSADELGWLGQDEGTTIIGTTEALPSTFNGYFVIRKPAGDIELDLDNDSGPDDTPYDPAFVAKEVLSHHAWRKFELPIHEALEEAFQDEFHADEKAAWDQEAIWYVSESDPPYTVRVVALRQRDPDGAAVEIGGYIGSDIGNVHMSFPEDRLGPVKLQTPTTEQVVAIVKRFVDVARSAMPERREKLRKDLIELHRADLTLDLFERQRWLGRVQSDEAETKFENAKASFYHVAPTLISDLRSAIQAWIGHHERENQFGRKEPVSFHHGPLLEAAKQALQKLDDAGRYMSKKKPSVDDMQEAMRSISLALNLVHVHGLVVERLGLDKDLLDEINELRHPELERRWAKRVPVIVRVAWDKTYMDVGHEPNTDTLHSMLWVFDPDTGEVHVDVGGRTLHHGEWKEWKEAPRRSPYGRCEVDDVEKSVVVSLADPDDYPHDVVERARAEMVAEFHPDVLSTSREYRKLFPNAPDPTGYRFQTLFNMASSRTPIERRGFYMAIGHEPNTRTLHNMMWFFDADGRLVVLKATPQMIHEELPAFQRAGGEETPFGRCEVDDAAGTVRVSFASPSFYHSDETVENVKAELTAEFHPQALAESRTYKRLFPRAPDPSGYSFAINPDLSAGMERTPEYPFAATHGFLERVAFRNYMEIGHDVDSEKLHSMIWMFDPASEKIIVDKAWNKTEEGVVGLGHADWDKFDEWHGTEKDEDVYRGVKYAPSGRCEVNDGLRKVNVSFGAVDMYPDDLVERIKAELVAEFHPKILATSPTYKRFFPGAPNPSRYKFQVHTFN